MVPKTNRQKGARSPSPGQDTDGSMFPPACSRQFKKASLTVEAALILPLFLFCMLSMLQFARVMETSVRMESAMAETGRQMAVAAYLFENPSAAKGAGTRLAVTALSSGYAHLRVRRLAGDCRPVQNDTMALSRFLGAEQSVDLVLTYQARTPFRIIPIGQTVFIQRIWNRAWTGRPGSGPGGEEASEGEERRTVYVAEHASVYHLDPDCTHLSLSIRPAGRDEVKTLRNAYGARYHACERCGDHGEGLLYITAEGDRYHSSLSCSGLKRTVTEVSADEVPCLRPCSRCGSSQ